MCIVFQKKRRYYPKNKRVVKEIAEELKIGYYWTKQGLETAKGEVQTWQWLGQIVERWIDSWFSERRQVFGVAENTKNVLVNNMNKWKLELTSNGVSLGNVEIRRGIFQGHSLSPLLFVLYMVSLSLILR